MSGIPGPDHVPGLAELRVRRLARVSRLQRFDRPAELGRRDADVLDALVLLEYAAVVPHVVPEDSAVRAAVKRLRGGRDTWARS